MRDIPEDLRGEVYWQEFILTSGNFAPSGREARKKGGADADKAMVSRWIAWSWRCRAR